LIQSDRANTSRNGSVGRRIYLEEEKRKPVGSLSGICRMSVFDTHDKISSVELVRITCPSSLRKELYQQQNSNDSIKLLDFDKEEDKLNSTKLK
jgi:hypothetical protein